MRTLRKGDKGEDVKTLQRLLGITADGNFGKKTFDALVAFQKSKNLVADGVAGSKTWAALGVVDPKVVDPCVAYLPLSACITKAPNRKIRYLIIHYTAGSSSATGAAKSMKGFWEQKKNASADFGVDNGTMVQFNPDPRNYYTWAVSGGNGITNANSISIEICSNRKPGTTASMPNHEGWFFTEASLNNAVRLAKLLMAKFNIPIERVVRHYDVTKKLCPGVIGWNDGKVYTTQGKATTQRNNSKKWQEFKEILK